MTLGFRELPFEDVLEDVSAGNHKIPTAEFKSVGRFPVVDQSKTLIAGFVDDATRLCHAPLPVIVFGDHTRCFKFVDFHFCMGADGIKVLRPKTEADEKYLYHFLRALRIPDAGYDRHFKYLKRTVIRLPPLPEQRRIAAILDKADELRAKRRAALAQLNGLTQSIFLEMFGDPITNPKRFDKKPLGSLASKIGSGATPVGGDAAYKAEGIALIRSMNVRNGVLLLKDLARIDERQAAKLSNVEVLSNDVLLNITGASVARVCRVPKDILPARVNQHVSIIRTGGLLSPVFLERLLLFPSMKAQLLQLGDSGDATRQAITKGQLEALDVILPSVADQRRFAERQSLVEKVCRDQDEFAANADSLFSSLQEQAFGGAL